MALPRIAIAEPQGLFGPPGGTTGWDTSDRWDDLVQKFHTGSLPDFFDNSSELLVGLLEVPCEKSERDGLVGSQGKADMGEEGKACGNLARLFQGVTAPIKREPCRNKALILAKRP